MSTDKEYPVKDLTVAAYLAYNKIPMMKPYDITRKSWIFDNTDGKCLELELSVRNGKATVSLLDYESSRKNLMGMVPRG